MGNPKNPAKSEAVKQDYETESSVLNQQSHLAIPSNPTDSSQSKDASIKDDLKIDSKKLGLVMYEIAKEDNSIFSIAQKTPIRISAVGVFLGLSSATLINLAHILIKPEQKYKKWFLIASLTNFIGSFILGGYGLYQAIKLYTIVPEVQWARIKAEKEIYQKLGFNEQKKFLLTKRQESKEQEFKNIELQKQDEMPNLNAKIDLVK